MRKFITVITLTFLLLTIDYGLSTVNAAVPHLLNYQGRLTDASGAPLNGSYNLTFRIYDAETAGNLLWQEQHTGVVIQKGIFSVLLGSITALDLPFDKQYFLAVQVGSDPEMSPRQRIASAGYAIRSEKTERLIDASAIDSGTIPTARLGSGTASSSTFLRGDQSWVSVGFGSWTSKSNDTVYLAGTDGFVCGIAYGGGNLPRGYTDGSNPPTTLRAAAYSPGGESLASSFTMPVRKGDYWRVVGCVTVY
jgi:hypothetical protein